MRSDTVDTGHADLEGILIYIHHGQKFEWKMVFSWDMVSSDLEVGWTL